MKITGWKVSELETNSQTGDERAWEKLATVQITNDEKKTKKNPRIQEESIIISP